MQNLQKGFTLIELMIAIAIIGILAAVAVPQYGKYVTESRRTDGQIALRAAAQEMERCHSRAFSYASCTISTTVSEESHYTVGIAAQTANTFRVTATPVAGGPQANDTECNAMGLNEQGVALPATCW